MQDGGFLVHLLSLALCGLLVPREPQTEARSCMCPRCRAGWGCSRGSPTPPSFPPLKLHATPVSGRLVMRTSSFLLTSVVFGWQSSVSVSWPRCHLPSCIINTSPWLLRASNRRPAIGILLFLFFFFKLYIIVLVLPNIKMNPPQVNMCSPS